MSSGHTAASAAQHAGAGVERIARAGRSLPPERRLAALAAIGMFVTLFLPWYQETVLVNGKVTSASLTGWGAFSFVEAAVLAVAAGVLVLLFQRAEGRAFHLPGGDGVVIMGAGGWACVLVVWRIFDKQSVNTHGQLAMVSGIDWGIFTALATAALLAYAGSRVRATHQPEPPLPGERRPASPSEPEAGDPVAPEPGPAAPPPDPTAPLRTRSAPQRPVGWLSAPAPEELSTRPLGRELAGERPERPPRPVPADDPARRS